MSNHTNDSMSPMLLDMDTEECQHTLRSMELATYSRVVSVLRAQGELTKEKRKVLNDLQNLFSISVERHRAEIRRAVNDELLSTIAETLAGPNTNIEWAIEGRRLIPLIPRSIPKIAYTALATRLAQNYFGINPKISHPGDTLVHEKSYELEMTDSEDETEGLRFLEGDMIPSRYNTDHGFCTSLPLNQARMGRDKLKQKKENVEKIFIENSHDFSMSTSLKKSISKNEALVSPKHKKFSEKKKRKRSKSSERYRSTSPRLRTPESSSVTISQLSSANSVSESQLETKPMPITTSVRQAAQLTTLPSLGSTSVKITVTGGVPTMTPTGPLDDSNKTVQQKLILVSSAASVSGVCSYPSMRVPILKSIPQNTVIGSIPSTINIQAVQARNNISSSSNSGDGSLFKSLSTANLTVDSSLGGFPRQTSDFLGQDSSQVSKSVMVASNKSNNCDGEATENVNAGGASGNSVLSSGMMESRISGKGNAKNKSQGVYVVTTNSGTIAVVTRTVASAAAPHSKGISINAINNSRTSILRNLSSKSGSSLSGVMKGVPNSRTSSNFRTVIGGNKGNVIVVHKGAIAAGVRPIGLQSIKDVPQKMISKSSTSQFSTSGTTLPTAVMRLNDPSTGDHKEATESSYTQSFPPIGETSMTNSVSSKCVILDVGSQASEHPSSSSVPLNVLHASNKNESYHSVTAVSQPSNISICRSNSIEVSNVSSSTSIPISFKSSSPKFEIDRKPVKVYQVESGHSTNTMSSTDTSASALHNEDESVSNSMLKVGVVTSISVEEHEADEDYLDDWIKSDSCDKSEQMDEEDESNSGVVLDNDSNMNNGKYAPDFSQKCNIKETEPVNAETLPEEMNILSSTEPIVEKDLERILEKAMEVLKDGRSDEARTLLQQAGLDLVESSTDSTSPDDDESGDSLLPADEQSPASMVVDDKYVIAENTDGKRHSDVTTSSTSVSFPQFGVDKSDVSPSNIEGNVKDDNYFKDFKC